MDNVPTPVTSPTAPPSAGRQRQGCLTALLVLMTLGVTAASIYNLGGAGEIAARLPHGPAWAQTGVVMIGLLGLPMLAGLIGMWCWRKWGLYLTVASALGVMVLNAIVVAVPSAVLGLVGPALLVALAAKQWDDFE